jgi:hypothetical protein
MNPAVTASPQPVVSTTCTGNAGRSMRGNPPDQLRAQAGYYDLKLPLTPGGITAPRYAGPGAAQPPGTGKRAQKGRTARCVRGGSAAGPAEVRYFYSGPGRLPSGSVPA